MGRSGRRRTAKLLLGEAEIRFPQAKKEERKSFRDKQDWRDYLDTFEDNNHNLPKFHVSANGVSLSGLTLAKSRILIDQSSPTKKEYSGHVVIGKDRRGQLGYYGVCLWGPGGRGDSNAKIYYSGDDPYEAQAALEPLLEKKLARGYSPTGWKAEDGRTGLDLETFVQQLP